MAKRRPFLVREKHLPIFDANGVELHLGDTILQGMRIGDPKGWGDPVVIVKSRIDDELQAEDPETGEREQLACFPELRGLVHCPHSKER